MKHYHQTLLGENWFTFPGLYSSVVREASNDSRFVEVGSWRGKSACFLGVEIINSGKNIELHCVDTWHGSKEHAGSQILNDDGLYREFLRNIEPLKQVIKPVRMSSLEAASLYDDLSIDFVFIDASHEYEDVLNDLNAWYPKVKIGGIFAGHDYTPGGLLEDPTGGVTRAVNDYFPNGNFQSTAEMCWIHRKTSL